MRLYPTIFFFILILLFSGPVSPAAAQSSLVVAPTPVAVPSDDQVNAVAHELYCPVCENIPLDVCPTQACSQWRDLIRQKLAQGMSKEQIKDYFASQYGDRVLSEPPRRGLNWLVYVLPPLIFLAGVWVVYRTIRHLHRPRPAEVAGPPSPYLAADPYLTRLEEELRKREQDGR